MSTAKHTPGPHEQPCACCILTRDGEVIDSSMGLRPMKDISRIDLCPLHKAAPAMYEALQGMLEWARRVKQNNPGPEVMNALKAIAQADGRQ